MPANVIAYEWPLNGTVHIAYQTNDNHIREVVGQANGKWRDVDVTRATGAPALENAIMAGSAWDAGRTHQVDYVSPMSPDGHVHEVVQFQNHPWSYEDLLDHAGVSGSDGRTLAAYDWRSAGTKQVVYTSLEGHIYELAAGREGPWQRTDLTQATGAPIAEIPLLSAFAWEHGKSKHVVYMSGDGHIHELTMTVGGSWSHDDLTERTGAPSADGNALAGYGWERAGTRQIVYTGYDSNIYELVAGVDHVWHYVDLNSLTSAPRVSGTALAAYAWETNDSKQVVYVAENHHIQLLQTDESGRWTHSDLTQRTGAPVASDTLILGYEWSAQFAQHIVYLDTRENPHLQSLLLEHGSSWKHADLTDLTGAQALV